MKDTKQLGRRVEDDNASKKNQYIDDRHFMKKGDIAMDNANLDIGITVDNELLSLLGDKLYSNPSDFILCRELLQNSVDSTASRIDIDYRHDEDRGGYILSVEDNGIGMTKDTLLNVFLGIGKSKKAGGAVGGFGIAKVAIFSCDIWEITTKHKSDNEYTIKGGTTRQGLELSTVEKGDNDSYTKVSVYLNQLAISRLWEALVINPTNRKVRIYLNGEKVSNPKTSKIISVSSYKDNDFTIRYCHSKSGDSYLDDHLAGRIYYRIGGLVQFSCKLYDLEKGFITVDFTVGYKAKDSNYPFSMSRESIEYSYDREVNSLIKGFMKDKLSRDNDNREKENKQSLINGILYTRPPDYTLDMLNRFISQDMKRVSRLYRDILIAILKDDNFILGITLETDVNGYNGHYKGEKVYGINPTAYMNQVSKVDMILTLWHLAIHEITHNYYSYHDENFTSKEGYLANRHARDLDENMSKLLKKAGYIEYLR